MNGFKYLSLKEAAEIAGYSYRYFHHLVMDKGRLPHYRPSGPKGNIRIRSDELHAWISRSLAAPLTDPRIKVAGAHRKVARAFPNFSSASFSLQSRCASRDLRRSGRSEEHGALPRGNDEK